MSFSDWLLPGAQPASEAAANEARLQRELQAKLDARNAAGTITPELSADFQAAIDQGALNDQDVAAVQGFGEGLAQGFENVLAAPGRAVGFVGESAGKTLWGIVKAVPWWAWALGIGALFVYLGGLNIIKRKVATL